ncbi:MAG: hypothetical protein Q9181_002015, partial [Wetmoreana brouardii]
MAFGSQPQPRKASLASSTASAESSTSKRKIEYIEILSSDNDGSDDVIDITPKKPRSGVAPSKHFKPETKYGTTKQSFESSGKSRSPSYSQRFVAVEVPVKKPFSGIIPKTPLAVDQRERFLKNLSELCGPRVTVVNEIDESSPSINFQFVRESLLGNGVSRATEEFMSGCGCRKDNGRNIGCEYLSCECLQDSAENADGKKVFPYSAAKKDPGCLRNFYLESRHHIYECNGHCNCDENCKNRNVQHGRRVHLEIFKTHNRGWGLRCPIPLRKGDFIDTYRGEIITVEEAEKRAKGRSQDEENYFMNFDKFTEPEATTKTEFLATFPDKIKWHARQVRDGEWEIYHKDGQEMWLNPEYVPYKYVCDGMFVGGPTRFMNHSCDPNCRLFTVSYNHGDMDLYDLAFFTLEEIPAGTELTFDYKDEDDRSVITDQQALEVKKRDGYMPQRCLCGSPD